MSTKKAITQIKAKKAALMEEIKQVGQTALREAFEQFFFENPQVTGIAWTQYTPYFMDGDPCEFGVNEPYMTVSTKVDSNSFDGCSTYDNFSHTVCSKCKTQTMGYHETDEMKKNDWSGRMENVKEYNCDTCKGKEREQVLDEGIETVWEDGDDKTENKDIFKRVSQFFNEVQDEDIFESAFGDHVAVTIDRKSLKFKINDYSHD